jgi:hypothetical protein
MNMQSLTLRRTMKLSKTQFEVLRQLAEPGAVARYMPGPLGGYWQIGTQVIKRSLMDKLRVLKLVIRHQHGMTLSATITALGRKVAGEG